MKHYWQSIVAAAVLAAAAPVQAVEIFEAQLDSSQVVSTMSTSTATGVARFVLSDDLSQLSYELELSGLDLEPVMANRTDANDVDKIHLHDAPAGATGPHVLNIFGLPSEDDADLVVDFVAESLMGSWDDGDAIDPNTGMPFDQSAGGTTKFLSNFIDELRAGELYIAVHTIGNGGGVTIRGQLQAVPVPLPFTAFLILPGLFLIRRFSISRC